MPSRQWMMRQPAGGSRPIRVVVAADERLLIEGVHRALERADDLEVVATVHNGRDLVSTVSRTQPDLVLLGLRTSAGEGLGYLDALKHRHPKVKAIVFSSIVDVEHVQAALHRGAVGYIAKTINPDDLASALRQAYEGTVYHALGAPEVSEEATARAAGLTAREVAILNALVRGLPNRSIAKELWVTEQTVKFHLTNIYRKLGVANRTEAAHYAYQHGLVPTGVREREP